MDACSQLTALIDLAERLGVMVRPGPPSPDGGDRPGGAIVRLKGKCMVFLDASAAPTEQADVLAEAMAGRAELETMYLPPEIRQLLARD